MKIVIIGAGTGGLCLAQGLKQDGVGAAVYERDLTPTDRLQGYRLSISTQGSKALCECLPAPLFRKLPEKVAVPSRNLTFLDHHLRRLLTVRFRERDGYAIESERAIARLVLRGILLEGLSDIVRFGKRFVGFEDGPDGQVTARFDDGSSATGDVLVGADSQLRAQLLPHARRIETGLVIVSGKLGLTSAVRRATPPAFFDGPSLILRPKGCFLFANAVEYKKSDRSSGEQEPSGREEYVMWGFSARRTAFDAGVDPTTMSGDSLQRAVPALMRGWHKNLLRMIETTPSSAIDAFSVKTSVPIPPWPTRNVNLLGDALHNMTPFRGIGANTALKDALALRRALRAFDRGEKPLIPALAEYERNMIDYGFAAVRAALKDMKRFHSENRIERGITKAFYRTLDWVPPLKHTLFGGH
jgi:2-polyprenyl-6-methoxyphenol hydroxylase-like FAD-dependent oxidoreductase